MWPVPGLHSSLLCIKLVCLLLRTRFLTARMWGLFITFTHGTSSLCLASPRTLQCLHAFLPQV